MAKSVGWGMQIGEPDWFFAIDDLMLLTLAFPKAINFSQVVCTCTKRNNSMSLFILPHNFPRSKTTDVVKIMIPRLIIYSLTQYLESIQQCVMIETRRGFRRKWKIFDLSSHIIITL